MRLRPSQTASISAVTAPAEYPGGNPSSASTAAVLSTDAPSESARSSLRTSSARIAAKSGAGLSPGGSGGGGAAGGASCCCAIAACSLSWSSRPGVDDESALPQGVLRAGRDALRDQRKTRD